MNDLPALPREIAEMLRSENDRVLSLWAELLRRECGIGLLPPSEEAASLAIICILDLSELLQVIGKALHLATVEWVSNESAGNVNTQEGLAHAVHGTRHHLDHAIVALSAASNHLASAMWHLHEDIPLPLGKNYKSAAQVLHAWSSRATGESPSFSILEKLLKAPTWIKVSRYRDEWVHRGRPVLRGELRHGRRQIWLAPTDPPPGPYIAVAKAPDGRVAYIVHNDQPQFDVKDLLAAARESLAALMRATTDFLPLLDQSFTRAGMELTEKGVRLGSSGGSITF